MNRRAFLAAIGGAFAGAALDPERALWVPGNKLISIPKEIKIPSVYTATVYGNGLAEFSGYAVIYDHGHNVIRRVNFNPEDGGVIRFGPVSSADFRRIAYGTVVTSYARGGTYTADVEYVDFKPKDEDDAFVPLKITRS